VSSVGSFFSYVNDARSHETEVSHLYTDIFIYLLTAVGLSPGGSSTVHIYTQTVHRTTQNKQYVASGSVM